MAMKRQQGSEGRNAAQARKRAARTRSEAEPRSGARSGATTGQKSVVGLVNRTLLSAVKGMEDVGAEMGSAAVGALRGSIRAGREVGGDLGRLATDATEGTIESAERIGAALARAVREVVRQAREGRPLAKASGRSSSSAGARKRGAA